MAALKCGGGGVFEVKAFFGFSVNYHFPHGNMITHSQSFGN